MWSVIRKTTEQDVAAVRKAALRFCARHGINYDGMEPEIAIDFECTYVSEKRLRRLWRKILKRILGSADGIAYGYVGYHQD